MGMYQWTANIKNTSLNNLKLGLQNLTGLEDIIVSQNGIHKKAFSSTIEQIWIEKKHIFILEPIGGPISNKYLDCSFFYLLKYLGSPIPRRLPKWAGRQWDEVKYLPWVRLRK